MDRIDIFLMEKEYISRNYDEMIGYLDEEEKKKALKYSNENSRLLYIGGRYLIRRYIGKEKTIYTSDTGKPYAEGIFFNISHSVDMVGIAISEKNEIGLDIEKRRKRSRDISDYCLTDEEKRSGHDFFTHFTSKESLVKAQGDGIDVRPIEIPSLPLNGKIEYKNRIFYRQSWSDGGYAFSVSVENEDFLVKVTRL